MSRDPTGGDVFDVVIGSDLEHDEVYAEIYSEGKFVALVSQERGPERLTLELPGPGLVEDVICREVDLSGFLEAVRAAVRRLAGE